MAGNSGPSCPSADGLLSPRTGARLERGVATITRAAGRLMTRIEHLATGVTQLVGMLARTPLVRGFTTQVAALASGLLGVHLLTQGALAARIVHAIPAAVTAVAWATNPWTLLGAVAVAFTGVTVVAGVRLLNAVQPDRPDPATTAATESPTTGDAFQAIVSHLQVVVDPDGSVRVDGIPADFFRLSSAHSVLPLTRWSSPCVPRRGLVRRISASSKCSPQTVFLRFNLIRTDPGA